jgi:hypothetical protein
VVRCVQIAYPGLCKAPVTHGAHSRPTHAILGYEVSSNNAPNLARAAQTHREARRFDQMLCGLESCFGKKPKAEHQLVGQEQVLDYIAQCEAKEVGYRWTLECRKTAKRTIGGSQDRSGTLEQLDHLYFKRVIQEEFVTKRVSQTGSLTSVDVSSAFTPDTSAAITTLVCDLARPEFEEAFANEYEARKQEFYAAHTDVADDDAKKTETTEWYLPGMKRSLEIQWTADKPKPFPFYTIRNHQQHVFKKKVSAFVASSAKTSKWEGRQLVPGFKVVPGSTEWVSKSEISGLPTS